MDIITYFQSYLNYFWEWTTDEDILDDTRYHENNLISIPNVGAIAYRPYVMAILKELRENGFPPFGSLLLVLYVLQDAYLNLDGLFYHLNKQKTASAENNSDIGLAVTFLENISRITGPLKKGQNKIILLQTIFKDSHNLVSSVNSGLILKVFETKPHILGEAAVKKNLTATAVSRDIKTLALLYNKFPTTESLVNAMRGFTDIAELEDEVGKEKTTVETDKDFIRELVEEPKTFQVGSLVKRIWSGLKVPMRHLSPGEQPIGGISDMASKGELHRMLLSEFANEDEIFMSRIANNEALYIQREIPPEENIFERVILIDTSLKNWGTPKVLAYAAAIAVVKHPKAHAECKVFTLGQNIIPISLDTVQDVVENLNQVSPVLEVSEALENFFNEKQTQKDLEVFFITHHENLANPDLQKIIHKNRDRLKFLVTTAADGALNFYKHHKGTRKHIQKIMLPLQELWAHSPQRKQKTEKKTSVQGKKAAVPLNYPILFPVPSHQTATFLYEGEFYILSNKKQLLRTYLSDNYYNKNYYDHFKINHGCEVLAEDISVKPKGQFALAKNKQGEFILCQYQPDKKLISKLNIGTKEYSELNLTGNHIPVDHQLLYFGRHFYLFHEKSTTIALISIDGNISLQYVPNDRQIYKNKAKVEAEIRKLFNSGIRILNNFTNIAINTKKNLVIANRELHQLYDYSIQLQRNRYPLKMHTEQDKNRFVFSDGSEIITDSRGMLTFRSSNKNIPEFYIPSANSGFLALATHTEFGGSEYYLPRNTLLKVRKTEEMYFEYMERFIDQIWEYGA